MNEVLETGLLAEIRKLREENASLKADVQRWIQRNRVLENRLDMIRGVTNADDITRVVAKNGAHVDSIPWGMGVRDVLKTAEVMGEFTQRVFGFRP